MNTELQNLSKTKLDLVPFNPNKEISKLEKLLSDPDVVNQIQSRSQLGASVGTIAAVIKVPTETFTRWVNKGKEQAEKYDPEFVTTPYMELWEILRSGWAEARTLAEAMFQKNNPEKFLKSKTSKLLGSDWEEEVVSSEEDMERKTLQVGTQLIESLKLLRKKGFSLDEIIDTDKMSLLTSSPPEKKEDILKKNGVTLKNDSLPSSLAYSANTVSPNSLDNSQ